MVWVIRFGPTPWLGIGTKAIIPINGSFSEEGRRNYSLEEFPFSRFGGKEVSMGLEKFFSIFRILANFSGLNYSKQGVFKKLSHYYSRFGQRTSILLYL